MKGFAFAPLALAALCLPPVAAHSQTNVWQQYNLLQVTGVERLEDGLQSAFRATNAKGLFVFETKRGVDGKLNGLPRHELNTPQGAFTWLDTSPEWTLQLPEPSLPELVRLFQPLRASKQELRAGQIALSQKFGQAIHDDGPTTFCDRPCEMLTVAGTDAYGARQNQRLVVDMETGLLLCREESAGGKKGYSCVLQSFLLNPSADAATFQMPPDAKTIRGLVNPEILLHAKETRDAAADMQQVRARSRRMQGEWIRTLAAPSGFSYVQTTLQEDGDPGPDAQLAAGDWLRLHWNTTLGLDGSALNTWSLMPPQNSAILYTGFIPASQVGTLNTARTNYDGVYRIAVMSDDGAAVPNAPATKAEQDIAAETESRYQALGLPPETDSDLLLGNVRLYSETLLQTGDMMRLNEANAALGWKTSVAPGAGNVSPNYSARVETDFLDRATGDTVSFFQLQNRNWKALLHGLRTERGTNLTSPKIGPVETYHVTAPFPLHLLVWRENGMEYLLASTRLDAAPLLALAETLPPANFYSGPYYNYWGATRY